MKTLSTLNRTMLAVACTALTFTSARLNADSRPGVNVSLVSANAGVTATLVPTADPLVQKATANGVVQSEQLGTCVENVELEVRFPVNPADPVILTASATFTSIKTGDTLTFTASGSGTPDAANPYFYNLKYSVTFTGGTGKYASASGLAEINEVVMFTSASTATATWRLKGFVVTPR